MVIPMIRCAIVSDNVIVNFANATREFAAANGWVECTEGFAIGDSYTPGAGFTPAPIAAPDLRAYAADARWTKETGGITIQGIPVDTTRDSQAMINGAFSLVSAEPSSIIKFKATGGFVELDAAAMTAIAVAVGQHVQTAFATEAEVLADIEAGTITTTAQIDAAFA